MRIVISSSNGNLFRLGHPIWEIDEFRPNPIKTRRFTDRDRPIFDGKFQHLENQLTFTLTAARASIVCIKRHSLKTLSLHNCTLFIYRDAPDVPYNDLITASYFRTLNFHIMFVVSSLSAEPLKFLIWRSLSALTFKLFST